MAKSKVPARMPRSLGRALIVEDDPLLAMALEDALLDGGAEKVVVCDTVAKAMEQLETLKPDILVLDVQLADRGDGWAMAELVTTLSPRPPMIVFSTGQPEKIPEKVASLGAILTKPYEPTALVALLGETRRKPGFLGRLREALAP